MNERLISEFWEIVKDCRNSPLRELVAAFGGRRLKKPDWYRKQMETFVSSLTPEQKVTAEGAVAYFVDSALFQLLSKLEGGEGAYDFELIIRNGMTQESAVVVGQNVDHDLPHEFFRRVSKPPEL